MLITLDENYINEFNKVIEKHNKALNKFGVTPITYKIINTEISEDSNIEFEFITYAAKFITIEINISQEIDPEEWSIVAMRTHIKDKAIVYHINKNIPFNNEWHETSAICQHCNHKRARNTTYVILNKYTNEFFYIGSTCIKDFTKNIHLEKILHTLYRSLNYLSEYNREDKNINIRNAYTLKSFLACVSASIKTDGWMSASSGKSTGMRVIEEMDFGKIGYNVTSEDFNIAEKTIDFINSKEETEGYFYNLKILFDENIIYSNKKHLINLAASAVQSYLKSIIEKIEFTNEFFGNIKERYRNVNVKIIQNKFLKLNREYSYYGIPEYIITFTDERNRIFKWFTTSSIDVTEGKNYTISFTVKKHSEWNDKKETIVNRVKIDS